MLKRSTEVYGCLDEIHRRYMRSMNEKNRGPIDDEVI
jgi:hypothetical protein